MCDQQRLRPACAFVQSVESPCQLLEYSMTIKLLTEQHLEFVSLKGGLSESNYVKKPHCWKSHAMAHIVFGVDPIGITVSLTLSSVQDIT